MNSTLSLFVPKNTDLSNLPNDAYLSVFTTLPSGFSSRLDFQYTTSSSTASSRTGFIFYDVNWSIINFAYQIGTVVASNLTSRLGGRFQFELSENDTEIEVIITSEIQLEYTEVIVPPSISNYDINNINTGLLLKASVTRSEADSDKNNKYKANFTLNQQINRIEVIQDGVDGVDVFNIQDDNYSLDLDRGGSYLVQFFGDTNTFLVLNPVHILNAENLELKQSTEENGNTLEAFYVEETLDYSYSIDGVNFQENNFFFGLTEDVTLSVKDTYGGVITQSIIVEEIFLSEAFFNYSKLNSIRMAERNNLPFNTNNTLSYEEPVNTANTYVHEYLSSDNVVLQFKSNYEENRITAIAEGNRFDLASIKKTNNINRTEIYTNPKTTLRNGLTGIYFTTGQILESDGVTVVEDYNLNGGLPLWATIGEGIFIGNDFRFVEDIIFDETLNVNLILVRDFDQINDITVSYNLFNYEVYEVVIPMGYFSGYDCFKLEIEASGSNFPTVRIESEFIEAKEELPNTIEVISRNNENNEIDYTTGYYHFLRLPYETISEDTLNESEDFKGDNTISLISAENYNNKTIVFTPVTSAIVNQIYGVLSLKEVYINRQRSYKNGSFEKDGALEGSNAHEITVNMLYEDKYFSLRDFIASTPISETQVTLTNISTAQPVIINGNAEFVQGGDNLLIP